ncbi:cobalamin biosynthesis protein CbiM [Methanohalobium evestigatum Z-7303]|uniref:Putative cobalt transport protein CbiM n=1 Tax=Methanohalobium evestigatum (strain ATCC BAA-1072 / DSM 3721 / NBRC 107634 / OCM 161 / Z-7303) TaxID=644295 RepID=D7EAL7_METEZ|nr:energy-coupling factor ABC transporter permease [Methanohalobium evestigatum]ADI75016.1 cobalamin biosynthesis protein CbiM [Methanohalobium evestigatum Z-7303]
MHIMEGFLPSPWWQLWFAISIPVIMFGIYKLNKMVEHKREILPLLAVAGAFIFVLSSLKLPSVTGSCSHPTGTGLGAILFGPAVTAVLSTIVLLYQAIFLAHGGLTTLGANVFAMGIIGPLVGYAIYKAGMKFNFNAYAVVFLAATFADWATYVATASQLSLAFPAEAGGILGSFKAFAGIFAVTQVPLAIMEGAVTTLIFKYIVQLKSEALIKLNAISKEGVRKLKGVTA